MIENSYEDAEGRRRHVPAATLAALSKVIGAPTERPPLVVRPGETPAIEDGELALESGATVELHGSLPPELPLGYHRLITGGAERRLIVSPGRCHLPGQRRWGWSAQLYATRSDRSWGMGDLADLEHLSKWARGQGASMLLVNPLLAVSPTLPRQPSPYFPATRRFRDPIYLHVETVPGAETAGVDIEEAGRAGRALNAGAVIDRDAVWKLKLQTLEGIWREADQGVEFEQWRIAQGAPLEEYGGWCMLAEHLGGDWRHWPMQYRRPDGPAVARTREDRRDRVRFHQWLQWLSHRQLERFASDVMVVQDLPIGFDPGGFDAWAWQDLIASEVSIGAPPDEFNTRGQNWGLPPFDPHRLQSAGYEPFIQTIRSNLIQGGGLRIDHVLGLLRQFWIPDGMSPAEGAYVRFPAQDLLDIVALESHRAEAVVVGEDLGTVEPGVRDTLAAHRLLSYRLLWFEEEPPDSWPALSMASVTTHDLPTVVGLWTGADLEEQDELDMQPNRKSTTKVRTRVADLIGLDDTADHQEVVREVHRRLAEAPSLLLCATLEDLARAVRRPNIPGSDAERDNWSIALQPNLDRLLADPLADQMAGIFDEATARTGEEPDGTA